MSENGILQIFCHILNVDKIIIFFSNLRRPKISYKNASKIHQSAIEIDCVCLSLVCKTPMSFIILKLRSFSESELSRASAMMDHLSIVHLNIQSLYPKLDILETEMQYYDIVVFTETWLTPNRKNDEIMIPNFDIPYRKDRNDRVGGGVAIYIKSGISFHKACNLIDNEVEGLCVEVNVRNHKFLLCGIYRPPNSGVE